MRPPHFHGLVLESERRLALPVAVYPGLALTGAKVSDIVTNPRAQFDAQAALHQRYQSSFVLSAMGWSVEAEAFGCSIMMPDTEVPNVTSRLVMNPKEAGKLTVPQGTPPEAKEHVKRRLEVFMPGGGFAFSAVHNILPEVPPQNIVAMFEAIGEFGKI